MPTASVKDRFGWKSDRAGAGLRQPLRADLKRAKNVPDFPVADIRPWLSAAWIHGLWAAASDTSRLMESRLPAGAKIRNFATGAVCPT